MKTYLIQKYSENNASSSQLYIWFVYFNRMIKFLACFLPIVVLAYPDGAPDCVFPSTDMMSPGSSGTNNMILLANVIIFSFIQDILIRCYFHYFKVRYKQELQRIFVTRSWWKSRNCFSKTDFVSLVGKVTVDVVVLVDVIVKGEMLLLLGSIKK